MNNIHYYDDSYRKIGINHVRSNSGLMVWDFELWDRYASYIKHGNGKFSRQETKVPIHICKSWIHVTLSQVHNPNVKQYGITFRFTKKPKLEIGLGGWKFIVAKSYSIGHPITMVGLETDKKG